MLESSVADNGMTIVDGGLGWVGIKAQCGYQKARTTGQDTQEGGEPKSKIEEGRPMRLSSGR
jgi:hypothetical protein